MPFFVAHSGAAWQMHLLEESQSTLDVFKGLKNNSPFSTKHPEGFRF
jgi:hypothetical protein